MNGQTALMQPPNAGPGGYPTTEEVMGKENAGAAAGNNNPVIQAIQTLTAFVVANKERFGNDDPLQKFQAFVDSLRNAGGAGGGEGEGAPGQVSRETPPAENANPEGEPMNEEVVPPPKGKNKQESKKAGPPKGFRREGKPATVLTQ